jgi:hypothetical protein
MLASAIALITDEFGAGVFGYLAAGTGTGTGFGTSTV